MGKVLWMRDGATRREEDICMEFEERTITRMTFEELRETHLSQEFLQHRTVSEHVRGNFPAMPLHRLRNGEKRLLKQTILRERKSSSESNGLPFGLFAEKLLFRKPAGEVGIRDRKRFLIRKKYVDGALYNLANFYSPALRKSERPINAKHLCTTMLREQLSYEWLLDALLHKLRKFAFDPLEIFRILPGRFQGKWRLVMHHAHPTPLLPHEIMRTVAKRGNDACGNLRTRALGKMMPLLTIDPVIPPLPVRVMDPDVPSWLVLMFPRLLRAGCHTDEAILPVIAPSRVFILI